MSETKLRIDFLEVITVRCNACDQLGPALIPNDVNYVSKEEENTIRNIAKLAGWVSLKNITLCPGCVCEITNPEE